MENLVINANPTILIPDPNPLVAASVANQHEGCESMATLMVGNVRPDKATGKIIPVSLIHGAKPPLYNLTLSRPEKLEDWLDSCDVNFMGSVIPAVYPAGMTLIGLPSIPNPFTIELPSVGLPNIPIPKFSFSFTDILDNLNKLVEFFSKIQDGASNMIVSVKMALNSLLQDLIAKIKLALPALSASVPIEWFVNLISKISPVKIPDFLGKLLTISPLTWPELINIPLPNLLSIPLPDLPGFLSLKLPTLGAIPGFNFFDLAGIIQMLKDAFTDASGRVNAGISLVLKWLAALKDKIVEMATGMLAQINIPMPFSFPGLPNISFPPSGTPWPAPFFPSGYVPTVSWPDWMKPPAVASVPFPIPPNGVPMTTAQSGVFSFQSLPGNFYQTFFAVNIKENTKPGIHTQNFYIQGSTSPSGAPLEKIAKVTAVCQVMEDTLSPGIRPYGAVTYK